MKVYTEKCLFNLNTLRHITSFSYCHLVSCFLLIHLIFATFSLFMFVFLLISYLSLELRKVSKLHLIGYCYLSLFTFHWFLAFQGFYAKLKVLFIIFKSFIVYPKCSFSTKFGIILYLQPN